MLQINNFPQKAVRLFNKNGGNGNYIKIFDDLPSDTKEVLLKMFNLEAGEQPIIGGCQNFATYFLLSDKNISQRTGDNARVVPLDTVYEVVVAFQDTSPVSKITLNTITIIDTTGNATNFDLVEALPFYGILNLLLFVSANNRRYKLSNQKDINSRTN